MKGSPGYIQRAMQVLTKLYGTHMVFVVATDDPQWAEVLPAPLWLLGHASK